MSSGSHQQQFGLVVKEMDQGSPKGAKSKNHYKTENNKQAARSSVLDGITVTAGERIERATITVRAKPAGSRPIKDVAQLRGTGEGVVIDLGRMRTVSGLTLPAATQADVKPWLGASYGPTSIYNVGADGRRVFSEVMTEKMLVQTSQSASAVGEGTINLSGAPADIEATVGGTRVFFQSGEAKRAAIGTTASSSDYFVAEIDVTDAVLSARPDASGKIPIELRASTPGVLNLSIQVTRTRVHDVVFPEGKDRVVSFAAEGTANLVVPLPDGSTSWHISELWMKVSARLEEQRITPAVGPAPSPDAELTLDGDHPVALQITTSELASFGSIAGVRVSIKVPDGTAELGGSLLADANGEPGEPLPGGDLVPTSIDEGAAFGWQSLVLRRPVVLSGAPLWLALQVAHGRLTMQLGTSSGGVVRRGRPGGPWRGFSKGVAVTPKARMRVIGEAPEGRPLYALAAALAGAPAVLTVPTADGALVQIEPTSPLTPTGNLSVALTAIAPGTYRFSEVQVFYRLAQDT